MKTLRVWLVLALVFFAGFAGGVLTTRTITRRVVQAVMAHPALLRGRIERDLDRKLKLDARQEAELHRVLLQSGERLKELRRDFQPRLHTILSETRQEISALLTPEQQRQFEKYLADHPLPSASSNDKQ